MMQYTVNIGHNAMWDSLPEKVVEKVCFSSTCCRGNVWNAFISYPRIAPMGCGLTGGWSNYLGGEDGRVLFARVLHFGCTSGMREFAF